MTIRKNEPSEAQEKAETRNKYLEMNQAQAAELDRLNKLIEEGRMAEAAEQMGSLQDYLQNGHWR